MAEGAELVEQVEGEGEQSVENAATTQPEAKLTLHKMNWRLPAKQSL